MREISVLLQQATAATLLSMLAAGAAAALAGLVALGLRFARRGAARFWLAPAFGVLALVPLTCGAALWAAGVGRTAAAAALLGTPGPMAVRAGLAEAVLPLLCAALGTFGVASLALLLLSFGRRGDGAPPAESGTPAVPAVAVLLAIAALALVLGVLLAARGVEASHAVSLAKVLAWTGGALTLCLFVAAFPLALRAPRGPAPRAPRVLALVAPAALAGGALLGAGAATLFVDSAMKALARPATPVAGRHEIVPLPPASSPPAGSASLEAERAATGTRRATPARVGVDVKEPRKLVHVPPRYPPTALQARVQGNVILECVIGPDGRVRDIEVKRGAPLLDDAARDAVRQWVYEPTLLDGAAVPVIMTVTVNFALH
ncbi:MAG: energy transducer TonB [Vicinamibacteria bacterium]